jgi:tRNA pseudouridine38-40 synthase
MKVVLTYDGTDFYGWQIQRDGRTVQGVVEEALEMIHGYPVRVKAAGRTDSGVHAEGQVINFITDSTVPDDRFAKALNSSLPRDIRAISSTAVDDGFHARYSARKRIYKYYILPGSYSDPFSRRFCLTVKKLLDVPRLNSFASKIVGTHDFTTFAAVGDQSESRIRDITSASFYYEGKFIVFKIEGNAFLWRMVRSLTGTILELAAENKPPERLEEILNCRDRSFAGSTAPAKGLTFHRVVYDG